jgi:hypothetical protein
MSTREGFPDSQGFNNSQAMDLLQVIQKRIKKIFFILD